MAPHGGWGGGIPRRSALPMVMPRALVRLERTPFTIGSTTVLRVLRSPARRPPVKPLPVRLATTVDERLELTLTGTFAARLLLKLVGKLRTVSATGMLATVMGPVRPVARGSPRSAA